jgi:hypothetical protein
MCHGRGISAHSRSINVSGSSTTLVLPSRQRRFNVYETLPSGSSDRRSSAIGRRAAEAFRNAHRGVQGEARELGSQRPAPTGPARGNAPGHARSCSSSSGGRRLS